MKWEFKTDWVTYQLKKKKKEKRKIYGAHGLEEKFL